MVPGLPIGANKTPISSEANRDRPASNERTVKNHHLRCNCFQLLSSSSEIEPRAYLLALAAVLWRNTGKGLFDVHAAGGTKRKDEFVSSECRSCEQREKQQLVPEHAYDPHQPAHDGLPHCAKKNTHGGRLESFCFAAPGHRACSRQAERALLQVTRWHMVTDEDGFVGAERAIMGPFPRSSL